MSERGSFVTEYIYGFSKNNAQIIWDIKGIFREFWDICAEVADGTIIVGKARSCYSGGEIVEFETEIAPLLQNLLPAGDTLRVAVLSDSGGEAVFLLNKNYIKSHQLNIKNQKDNDIRCIGCE